MPDSVKEALRSDGTAFTVVGDSNITAGVLLTNGVPQYPIVISLASEAIRDDEIAQLTNYVAAGGFLLVGSSAFTRNTNGTTRGDFAIANQMGVHMVVPGLTNWTPTTRLPRLRITFWSADIPSGATHLADAFLRPRRLVGAFLTTAVIRSCVSCSSRSVAGSAR